MYPILGSLLGVDTSVGTCGAPLPGTSASLTARRNEPPANDLFGYLNNNSSGAASLLQRESFMQCKHCNRYYKSHQKLQEHVRKYCLKEKKYKCISCEYRSRRKDHVLRHAKRKHCELYAASRDNEESLYEIRTEEEGDEQARYEEHTVDYDGVYGGDGDGEADDGIDVMPVSALLGVGHFGFGLGSRDLTITAVPILQDSDDDDDDNYDDEDD